LISPSCCASPFIFQFPAIKGPCSPHRRGHASTADEPKKGDEKMVGFYNAGEAQS
jgi:hypothetical protein